MLILKIFLIVCFTAINVGGPVIMTLAAITIFGPLAAIVTMGFSLFLFPLLTVFFIKESQL